MRDPEDVLRSLRVHAEVTLVVPAYNRMNLGRGQIGTEKRVVFALYGNG